MTTSQKFEYKTEGYKAPWDPTTSITAYFTGLKKFKNSLADRGISTSVEEITMAAGARMWENEMFTEDQLVLWENKPAANQTWQALQDYFMEKWLERRQYSQATAKDSYFKDAALAAQEQLTAKEEGKASAMMFALLQEKSSTRRNSRQWRRQTKRQWKQCSNELTPSSVANARPWTRRTRHPQLATRAIALLG
jgi:hypothetical protein